ncbi:universal stress protein [Spirosoma flavum]|uniref:Universal stress protein n=1 Tax=Spirosoma flavum TaxID=2048557 RepID=A0ABW6AKZ7_9BACT
MKKILLLTDFSEASRNALSFARSFFSDTVVDFHLLCANVAEIDEPGTPDTTARPTPTSNAGQLHNVVTALRREATNDWHTFRSSSWPGEALDAVEQAVKAEGYDFVVIGPQSDETDELFGNSAITLVRRLRANVLVVPGDARPQPVHQIVLAADFANLKNSKLLGPLKELVILKGATLTLLTIDTPNKDIIRIEREARIRQFLHPIVPSIVRMQSPSAKRGIDAYLTAHPVDLLVTIPKYNDRSETLTSSRVTRLRAFAPAVPLLTLYDDGGNDRPQPINDLTNEEYAL